DEQAGRPEVHCLLRLHASRDIFFPDEIILVLSLHEKKVDGIYPGKQTPAVIGAAQLVVQRIDLAVGGIVIVDHDTQVDPGTETVSEKWIGARLKGVG